jgi:hypothetical protein
MSLGAAFRKMGNRESRDSDRQTWRDARLRRAHDGIVEAPLPEDMVTLLRRLADKTAPADGGRDDRRIGRGPAKGEKDGELP